MNLVGKFLCIIGCHKWETTYDDGIYECGRCGEIASGPLLFEDEFEEVSAALDIFQNDQDSKR